MSWSSVAPLLSVTPSKLDSSSSFLPSSSSSVSSVRVSLSLSWRSRPTSVRYLSSSSSSLSLRKQICRAAEYKFPDPIPEFADEETEKFRTHLLNKLSKKDLYEDSVEEVVGICTEIFSTFLHTEYGGPGTLLVVPFIDMADTLNECGLPGGQQAARAAIKWAQNHVDKDWNEWTGDEN
ncbi:hypothetical protein L3X38_005344 [Prunus dulcis]|uniref:Protein PLASTID REDOX INSENSITIVE 2 n=1 Tax=Prunus dulcis TaxID=3755 RepID=A0AAD4ZQM3_PRUDU|nr:hypothetical protein L3X38_005344 [Prunus dulcis]